MRATPQKVDFSPIRGFLSRSQSVVLAECVAGEEGDFFVTILNELTERIRKMPGTYEQDGKGEDAIVYLHYFKGGAEWFITERDVDEPQHQAFGLAVPFSDGGELGYISIVELVANAAELDLYWTPKPLRECRQ